MLTTIILPVYLLLNLVNIIINVILNVLKYEASYLCHEKKKVWLSFHHTFTLGKLKAKRKLKF